MRRVAAATATATATAAMLATACGGVAAHTESGAPAPSGSITVLAAASLTEAFTGLARPFRAAYPGVDVIFSFDASSALVQQVKAGAPADDFRTLGYVPPPEE